MTQPRVTTERQGKIVQRIGAVVDVGFPHNQMLA